MSDFDAVLERLLAEPSFAAALAADPGAALLGYRLDPDEVALLHSQVTGDTGGERSVEVRANQSSVFGMLSPLAGMIDVPGVAQGGGPTGVGTNTVAGAGGGFAVGAHAGAAFATAGPAHGPAVPPLGGGAFLPVAAVEGFGGVAAVQGFGAVASQEGFGAVVATEGLGAAGPVQGFGTAPPPAGPEVPAGYHTRVDADADGRWDRYTLRGGAERGVDILVDVDNDGRADFVGHDRNADGLVESASFDDDRDGFADRHGVDIDGDGWLDRPH